MTPFWVSAFVDLAPDTYDDGLAFWQAVTGWRASPVRGDAGEFVTLVPPAGDDHLRVQRLASGRSRIHLDLHVASPRETADRAIELGAREVADLGHVVLASPGGFPFCLVSHRASAPAPSTQWPAGHRSTADQVCLDIPSELFERELSFWLALTGRTLSDTTGGEFRRLPPPPGQPLQLLLQRLDDPLGEVRAHLDLSTTDRAAEVERHLALGARLVAPYEGWTVLTDPAGSAYCVTDRRPPR